MGRILVIDDEPSTRVLFKSRLEDLGHRVMLAANGAEGLMAARSGEFDLFLVDIGLGSGVDGFEVCRRLKAVPQTTGVPVVLISGQSTTREDLHRGYNAGCESFLMKGNMTLLEDVLRAMLRIKSLKDDIAVQNYLLERQNRRLQEEMAKRGVGESDKDEERRGPEAPVGLLLVGHDGLVHHADRGARDLFGAGLEGQPLGVLAPSRGLEAFVRDARIEERTGFRLDLSARAGRVARSLIVSVLPTMPRGDSDLSSLKAVVFHDLVRSAGSTFGVRDTEAYDAPLLEAARRRYRTSRIVGSSLGAIALREQLDRACKSTAPVLLSGGEGTGKVFAARVLHFSSDRSGRFLRFDAQSVAPEKLHFELFGTNAEDKGLVHRAHLGTLMITNAEALDKKTQKSLAELIERGVLPGKDKSKVRLRLVLSTQLTLAELDSGRGFQSGFRDLVAQHRMTVISLAERREDIASLANEMAREISGNAVELGEADITALESYEWPGNVRELEDCVEILVAAALGDPSGVGSLPEALRDRGHAAMDRGTELQPVPRRQVSRSPDAEAHDTPVSLDAYERLALERALREADGDKLAAARLLKVGKSTLYRKLKRHGIS
jgi:two-component system response regulator HydG